MKKLVAITGASGTLGSILARKLEAAGHRVAKFTGDVCDGNELDHWLDCQPDALFHLAAVVPVDQVQADPFHAMRVNVGGTLNLLSALAEKKLNPWVFYASSSHVYRPAAAPLKEEDPVGPINTYGESKLLGERLCECFVQTTKQPLCIGRIFSFYDASQREPFLYPSLLRQFAELKPNATLKLHGAANVRDLSPAADIVDKMLVTMHAAATGTINIGSGVGITIADFAKSVAPFAIEVEALESGPTTSLVANIEKLRRLGS